MPHTTAEAGESSPRDPVKGRGHRQVAPLEGQTSNTLRAAVGRVIGDPLAAGATPISPEEIGGDPRFIEKDEAGRVEGRGGGHPVGAGGRDVGTIVFGRAYRFF